MKRVCLDKKPLSFRGKKTKAEGSFLFSVVKSWLLPGSPLRAQSGEYSSLGLTPLLFPNSYAKTYSLRVRIVN